MNGTPDIKAALDAIDWAVQSVSADDLADLVGALERLRFKASSRQVMKAEPGLERFLKPEEVANLLNVPKSFVYEAARNKELSAVKFGKYVRFSPTDVAKYREKQRA